MKHWFSGLVSLIALLVGLQPIHAQVLKTITQCDYQHISKAIAVGGGILLDCEGKIQIWANKPLTITSNTSIAPIDGNKVTFEALKGRAFVVNQGVSFILENMRL
nr:hypothetical protein [Anaerolineae bacterium]